MKARKVFDAIDLLTGGAVEVESLPVDEIRPFHNHPFRLYEGQRLNEMVESVREHGILSPVIVQRLDDGYEMLAGHNRYNAAKIVGLPEIPAIVKEGLTEEEAYVYVIETNMIQRSFSELSVSEKAAVLKERYDKIACQGKRNDILEEIKALENTGSKTSDQVDQKLTSRQALGDEYDMSESSVARLLRVNNLIPELKEKVDEGTLPVTAAVNLSYLDEDEQKTISQGADKISLKQSSDLKKMAGNISEETVKEVLEKPQKRKEEKKSQKYKSVKVKMDLYEKYFSGMEPGQVEETLEKALERYFED